MAENDPKRVKTIQQETQTGSKYNSNGPKMT